MSHYARWAGQELAPWRRRGLTKARVNALIDAAVIGHGAMFRYDISKNQVVLHSKPADLLGPHADPAVVSTVLARAEAYRVLLERSRSLSNLTDDFSLTIDVSDVPPSLPDLPFFAFQKAAGSSCILLPDVDLLGFAYLEVDEFSDTVAFADKVNRAIFAGSTTGDLITEEKIASGAVPRLRAAAAFKESAHVDFSLPGIVQCDAPKTEAVLRDLRLGDRFIDWSEQFRHRHLISMDGNGAACLRVAIALNSNSVLLKYDSPYQLFYFKGLAPWVHYVPVEQDGEVEGIVIDSETCPGRYERIAQDGQRFFRKHLSRMACERYVAVLLRKYLWMLEDGESFIGRGLPVRARHATASTLALTSRGLRKGARILRKAAQP